MWVARDKTGELTLFKHKPIRDIPNHYWIEDKTYGEGNYFFLPEDLFDIKWEDEPVEVNIFSNKKLENSIFKACDALNIDYEKTKQIVETIKNYLIR